MTLILATLIFLSYSHQDLAQAKAAQAQLLKAGCTVWMDDQIWPGESWSTAVEKAIDRSDVVVVALQAPPAQLAKMRSTEPSGRARPSYLS